MSTKVVAGSLKNVLDYPEMEAVLDLTSDVESFAKKMLDDWGFDLFTRKPKPSVNAYGEFEGTDLDLSTFMTALAERGAVIVLPTYERMRAATVTAGVRHLPGARNGKILNLYANREAFSFGVKIKDMSVVSTDPSTGMETPGLPRNFALIDVEGKWHDGWKRIEFSPTAKENDFLSDHNVWTENTIVVKNFVHPNRWQSFYGNPYFMAKAMVFRLTAEATFLRSEVQRLQLDGLRFPETGFGAQTQWPDSEMVGETRPIKVKTMAVELDLPDYTRNFVSVKKTVEAMIEADRKARYYSYNLAPSLRFVTRGVEYAFFCYGLSLDGLEVKNERMPGWVVNARWEKGFRLPRKRNEWNRLILFQPAVGKMGVGIRYRIFEKTERVSVN